MSEQAGRYQRSFSGLIGALLVLVLAIGVFVVLRDLNRVDPADPVHAVDYATPAGFAQRAAHFELLTPPRLPAGWIATSVRFEDGSDGRSWQSWHVGLLTDDQRYIGIEQAERPVAAMVADFVDQDAERAGEVDVDGTAWTRYVDPGRDPGADPSKASDGDLALVRETDGATTLVVGTAAQDEITALVASLR